MKKILVVCALSQELNTVKQKIKSLKLKNIKISFFTTWKGNYLSILNLTKFLENNNFDFIVNIWVCGYLEKSHIFQVSRIYNLSNSKELIVPTIISYPELWSIVTSEKVVYNSSILEDENFVDMESYGLEIVCDSFKIPRVFIKLPVDKVWKETINFDFEKAKTLLEKSIDYDLLLSQIISYLEKQKPEENLDLYFDFFDFTFSEKQIFKKLYSRYKSLVKTDFSYYFEKNKQINKKEFIKNLDLYLDNFLIK